VQKLFKNTRKGLQVPPPPNPPAMTEEGKNLATERRPESPPTERRTESPPRCNYEDRAVICEDTMNYFAFPDINYVSA
jgi:hypothetical protein